MGQCSVRCPSDEVLICSAACHFEDEVSTIGSFKYLPFKLSEMVSSLARFGALCAFVLPSVSAQSGGSTRQLLTNVTVFDPPDNYTVPRTLYARVRKLDCDGSNTLLATWENYLPTENNTAPCPDNCPLNPYHLGVDRLGSNMVREIASLRQAEWLGTALPAGSLRDD
jgi:hypothetical protein